jgi:hypothetical protein
MAHFKAFSRNDWKIPARTVEVMDNSMLVLFGEMPHQ